MINSNISLCLSGHSLDDKSDGHPISSELQSLTNSLEVMTDLANNLTAEYKKNFNLLFWKQIISRMTERKRNIMPWWQTLRNSMWFIIKKKTK